MSTDFLQLSQQTVNIPQIGGYNSYTTLAPLALSERMSSMLEAWNLETVITSCRLPWQIGTYTTSQITNTSTQTNVLNIPIALLVNVLSASSHVTVTVTPVSGPALTVASAQGPYQTWIDLGSGDGFTITYDSGSGFGTNLSWYPANPAPPEVSLTILLEPGNTAVWNWTQTTDMYAPPIAGTNPGNGPGGGRLIPIAQQFYWPVAFNQNNSLQLAVGITNNNQVPMQPDTLFLHEAPGTGIGFSRTPTSPLTSTSRPPITSAAIQG